MTDLMKPWQCKTAIKRRASFIKQQLRQHGKVTVGMQAAAIQISYMHGLINIYEEPTGN